MIQTVEATIDEMGEVRLSQSVRLQAKRRALVTILEEAPREDEDLAPARTQEEMAAAHRARREQFAPGEAGYVSIDLPLIDDGADW